MGDIYNVRTSKFIYFRRLVKKLYKQGYKFESGQQYRPLSMWVGLVGFSPIRGLEVNPQTKRLKFFDIKHWDSLVNDSIDYTDYVKTKLK
jgi:hypothetical protein